MFYLQHNPPGIIYIPLGYLLSNITPICIVGLYGPVGSALECETIVLRSIHSYGELRTNKRIITVV